MGKGIAKVDILKIQNAGKKIIVEVNVEIGSKTSRKRYTLDKNSTSTEIKKHINDKIKEEENKIVTGERFEVNLDG